jgi:DNA-directed RNA polymerase specialized sigma24 family protein
VRDRGLAKDLVQSAFIRVYEHIDQFDEARLFAPWFLRIEANDAAKTVCGRTAISRSTLSTPRRMLRLRTYSTTRYR